MALALHLDIDLLTVGKPYSHVERDALFIYPVALWLRMLHLSPLDGSRRL